MFSQGYKLDSLLFIAFFATLPLYSPNLIMFHDLLGGADTYMPLFVNAMLLSAAVLGIAAACLGLTHKNDALFRLPAVALGVTCYAVGFVLFAATLGLNYAGMELLATVAGVLMAAGSVELCICWGAYLAWLGLRQALSSVAVMIGVASLAELLMSAVAIQAGLICYAILLVLGAALPCWKAAAGQLNQTSAAYALADADYEELIRSDNSNTSVLARLTSSVKDMGQVLALPFTGLLIYGYMMGVRKFLIVDTFHIEILAGIIAAVLVLPMCAIKDKPLLPFAYQVLLPLSALFLVLFNSFPTNTPFMFAAATLSYVFYAVVSILALSGLCAMAHAREFPPALIFGLSVASFSAVSLFGIFCGSLELFQNNDEGGPILMIISTCYFVLLLAVPVIGRWNERTARANEVATEHERLTLSNATEEETEEPQGAAAQPALSIQERCEIVASNGGLSPRETEVMSFLGRGYGIAFAAKALFVSESTVRTHVKNIYKKLHVNSREELLQLVDKVNEEASEQVNAQ